MEKIERKNLELKIKLDEKNFERILKVLQKGQKQTSLKQKDTYFKTNKDYLKLREEEQEGVKSCFLIGYQRAKLNNKPFDTNTINSIERKKEIDEYNNNAIKESHYYIVGIDNSKAFKKCVEGLLQVKEVIKKTRELFIIDTTRIHLDKVKGYFIENNQLIKKDLGLFLEIEIVIKDEDVEKKKEEIMSKLIDFLGIKGIKQILGSYSDLLHTEE